MRSCSCVIVARCSRVDACCAAFVTWSSPTGACKVAVTDGITHQNVEGNPPGTPSLDSANGYHELLGQLFFAVFGSYFAPAPLAPRGDEPKGKEGSGSK